MIVALSFLLFFLAGGVGAYYATRRGLFGPWAKQGPKYVTDQIASRNRRVLLIALVAVVAVAVVEAVVPAVHEGLLDVQYRIGDGVGAADPVGVATFGSGSGLSWGLYLSTLVGLTVGLVVGSLLACRAGDTVRSVSPQRMLV